MLDFAIAYAEHGWAVVPLHRPNGDGCSCGKPDCGSPAKHPRTLNGLKDATTDAERIRALWQPDPLANIGIAVPDGYVVLDFDTEDVGRILDGRELPTTATARTARGWHFWYRTERPLRPRVGALEHLDLRGPGSYVVAPPSRHLSGAEYVWVTRPADGIADAPGWLYALSEPRMNGSAVPSEPIPAGKRNATLTTLAGTMRAKGATQPTILAALTAENAERCVPPLPEAEVARIAASVARYAPAEDGPVLTAGEPPTERPHAKPATSADTAAALADPWRVEGVVRPARLAVFASQEGVGKSQVRTEMGIRLATGRGNLFDHYVIPRACRVLLFDVENGEDEETRREEDVLARLELNRAQLGDYWRVSLEGLLLTDPDDQRYIRGEIEHVRPAVAVFDTGSSMVGEEWGRELKLAVRFLRGLAREYGCAVVVAVHLVKPNRQAKHAKDAPEHGTELSDVMGQWTRQADSVALMARTKDDQIVWTMRKRVPRSTLVLATSEGTFRVVSAAVGGDLGADTRAAVDRLYRQGVTDTAAIATTLGVSRRTVQRHVAKLEQAAEDLSPPVAAPVAAIPERETTPLSPGVADIGTAQPADVATVSLPPIGGSTGDMSPAVGPDAKHASGFSRFVAEAGTDAAWARVSPDRGRSA